MISSSSSFKIFIFLIFLFPCFLRRLNGAKEKHGDKKLSVYIYISWLIESNNVRLIAFGEERIGRVGLSRKGKGREKSLPSAGSDYRGQSSYPRRWRKYPNPNICTGCRNGRPHVTLIALVFVTLYIIR